MNRRGFIYKLDQLHFVIFPHAAKNYQLTASGTLLDALACEKPLITRRIALFENMFLKHGDIGYLFSADLELQSIVNHIMDEMDLTRYHRQVLDLKK